MSLKDKDRDVHEITRKPKYRANIVVGGETIQEDILKGHLEIENHFASIIEKKTDVFLIAL
jgi:hypothetical protein